MRGSKPSQRAAARCSRIAIAGPAIMAEKRKINGNRSDHQRTFTLCGMQRHQSPSDDWWRCDSVTPRSMIGM